MSLEVLALGMISGLRPGTLSLAIPSLPPFEHLTAAHFGYVVAFGLVAGSSAAASRCSRSRCARGSSRA